MTNFWLTKKTLNEGLVGYSLLEAADMLLVSSEFLNRMLEMGIIFYTGRISSPIITYSEIERFEEVRRIHDDLSVNWGGASLIVDLLRENLRLSQELAMLNCKVGED